MALVNGFDPLCYLDLDDSRVRVMNKVIEKAQELRSERKLAEMKALATLTAQQLAKLF